MTATEYPSDPSEVAAVSPSSSSSSEDGSLPEFVRMILLSDDMRHVLMFNNKSDDGEWDFPFFYYPKSILDKVDICCQDLQNIMDISPSDDETHFTVPFEILGYCAEDRNGENGFAYAMVVENHLRNELRLPEFAAWKDENFVEALNERAPPDEASAFILKEVSNILKSRGENLSKLRDPRAQFGWFDEATAWMGSVLSKLNCTIEGRVVQEHVSPTSTLLKARTAENFVFLKSPSLGCEEGSMTAVLGSLFPGNIPDVLARDEKLNSFVSKGFEHLDLDETHSAGIVMEMGRFQLESLEHMEELKAAKFEDRSPARLATKLEEWKNDADAKRTLGRSFPSLASHFIAMCSQLADYSIPNTLVHGDLSLHNATLKPGTSNGYILFDWQYASIGHPFFDLHEIHEDLSPEAVSQYLALWHKFETPSGVREAYDLARRLGWWMKIWSMINCIKQSNPQVYSGMEEFAYDCYNLIKNKDKLN